jgi:hypothetical protein
VTEATEQNSTQFLVTFTASGVVGQGTAEHPAEDNQSTEDEGDQS